MIKLKLLKEISSHNDRVADMAHQFARYIELGPVETKHLIIASKFHDVGKAKVNNDLLSKVGVLTNEEMDQIRTHAIEGARILEEQRFHKDIIEAVRHHHESFDGTGYPDKLKGHQIPLLSLILKLCDVYDALTFSRCYRPITYTHTAAIEIMNKMENEFDPTLFVQFKEFIQVNSLPKTLEMVK